MTNETRPTDKEILDTYRSNRSEGFRLMYLKYSERLCAVCRRYSTDEGQTLDNFHEAMLRADSKIGTFRWRGEGSLFSWIRQMALNMMIDRMRKRKQLSFVEVNGYDSIDEACLMVAEEEAHLSLEEMYQMIESLSPAKRVVFNLFCIEELPQSEIARMLGITENGVSSTLSRARKDLARLIKEYLKQEEP